MQKWVQIIGLMINSQNKLSKEHTQWGTRVVICVWERGREGGREEQQGRVERWRAREGGRDEGERSEG